MRNKAVAIHAASLIVIIALVLIFSLIIFSSWLQGYSIEASKTACGVKKTNFCIEWARTDYQKEPDWSASPKDCEKNPINIYKPTIDECKDILLQPKY